MYTPLSLAAADEIAGQIASSYPDKVNPSLRYWRKNPSGTSLVPECLIGHILAAAGILHHIPQQENGLILSTLYADPDHILHSLISPDALSYLARLQIWADRLRSGYPSGRFTWSEAYSCSRA